VGVSFVSAISETNSRKSVNGSGRSMFLCIPAFRESSRHATESKQESNGGSCSSKSLDLTVGLIQDACTERILAAAKELTCNLREEDNVNWICLPAQAKMSTHVLSRHNIWKPRALQLINIWLAFCPWLPQSRFKKISVVVTDVEPNVRARAGLLREQGRRQK
jgi:hypothetical protein